METKTDDKAVRDAYARGYSQARTDIAMKLLEMRVPMHTISAATGISIAELQAYPMG